MRENVFIDVWGFGDQGGLEKAEGDCRGVGWVSKQGKIGKEK